MAMAAKPEQRSKTGIRTVADDLAISILGYAGLISAMVGQLLLAGAVMRGRGRAVVLAAFVFVLALLAQYYLLNEDLQICALGWCLHDFVVSVQRLLGDLSSPIVWLGKFTSFTLANTTILLFGPSLVLLIALFSRGLNFGSSSDGTAGRARSDDNVIAGPGDRLRALLIGRSAARLYRDLFWCAVVMGGAIVCLAASNPRGAALRDLAVDFTKLLWAAPILCFGVLWSASRPVPRSGSNVAAAKAEPPTPPPPIKPLFDSYVQAYGKLLLFQDVVRPAASGVRETNADPQTLIGRVVTAAKTLGYSQLDDMRQALEAAFGQFWEEPEGGRLKLCPIFEESLTFLHFVLFAEFILSCQDRGGCTLLLAPKASLGRIEEELRRALSVHFAGYAQQIWNSRSEPHGLYDILIVSLEDIEANLLSRDSGSLVDALERLDLLMILDYQNMDASLLRMRLARLRRLTDHRTLKVVCQSEPRAGLQSKLANTVSAFVPVRPWRVEIGGSGSAERFWLFWRNELATLEALNRQELHREMDGARPLEVVPLALSRAMRQGYGAVYFDPYGRASGAIWQDAMGQLRIPQQQSGGMEAEWTKYPGDGDRVVLIEDVANLIAAARKNLNFMHHRDCLTHVVSHNYPIREYLLDVLRSEVAVAARSRESWTRIGEMYMPIAPNPTGGPTELVIDLATEFMRADTVKQRDIEARFREVLRDRVAETLEIAPTKHGLTKLFEHQRDIDPDIQVTETVGHEQEFGIKIAARTLLEPRFLLPVMLGDRIIDHVDQQDEGLTYFEGTLLQIDRSFFEIVQVTNTMVQVRYAEFPGTHRPLYLFVRHYAIDFDPRLIFVDDKDVPDSAVASVAELRLLLRGNYVRRTLAMAKVNEVSFELKRWEDVETEKGSQNASIMLARFVLAESHVQVKKLKAEDFSRLAFTLAATLHDTLRCFFPSLASTLAVLSPQAGPSVDSYVDLRTTRSIEAIDELPFKIYPYLVGEHFERPEHEGDTPSDKERRFNDRVEKGAAPARLVRESIDRYIRSVLDRPDSGGQQQADDLNQLFASDPKRVIDLIVIEDASHDRGAVRALFEDRNWLNVVKVWSGFLRWSAAQRGRRDFYYKFGWNRVPKVFAFEEAADFLDSLVQSRTTAVETDSDAAARSRAGAVGPEPGAAARSRAGADASDAGAAARSRSSAASSDPG
jgi:hypothetical protein